MILFIILFSFVVQAKENTKDLDVGRSHIKTPHIKISDIKNLTDQQIHGQIFLLKSALKFWELLKFCNDVLEQKPYNPEAHFGKGKALSELKKWREAVDSYDLAIKYKRKPLGEVYYEKGMTLDERYAPREEIKNFLEKIGMSLDDIRKPLHVVEQSFKDKGVSLEEREKFLEKIWRIEEAFRAYDFAIENGYDDREAHYGRIRTLIRLGRLHDDE